MMKKQGVEYIANINNAKSKKELFDKLFAVMDKDIKFEDLMLKENPLVVSLEASKAKYRMQHNENKLKAVLSKINSPKAKGFDKVLVGKLTHLGASAEDYTHIAMDKYYKSKMGTNFNDFAKDWKKFSKDNQPQVLRNMFQQRAISV